MMSLRRIALTLVSLLLAGMPTAAQANGIHNGSACSKPGAHVTVARVPYQCVRSGNKLVWVAKASTLSGDITVFAAASLTEAFTAIGHAFHSAHPSTHVTFSFGGSSALAQQILNGAPADVFASASNTNMQQVLEGGTAAKARSFIRNRLIVVMPPGNPAHIRSLADLAKPDVKLAVCQAQVPCGAAAAAVFSAAHVRIRPVTYEADVKSVLTKVELGEVDAGVVYVSDAHSAAKSVTALAIPRSINAATTYPIALLRASTHTKVAQAFINFVLSRKGAAALTAAGFTAL